MSTFGKSYDERIDKKRLSKQMDVIKNYMIYHGRQGFWRTLQEISAVLVYPESSVSAQLRHFRKLQFGGFIVNKRRRNGKGTWEYQVLEPKEEETQTDLFDKGLTGVR